ELDSIYAEIEGLQDASCNSSDGIAVIDSISGGFTPYRFSLDNGNTFQSSPTLTDLSAGKHILVIEDFKGCRKNYEVSVNQKDGIDIKSINSTVKNLTCYNANIGSVSLSNISGGQRPYTFTMDSNLTKSDSTFKNLS